MCISPIKIRNPNYGTNARKKDTKSVFIYVPCGQCAQCRSRRQLNLVQRVQMESFNSYLYFVTLTYNNDSLPVLVSSLGYRFPYVEWSDFQNMFKRIRQYKLIDRPFKYLAVSELGSKKGRPHIHFILALARYDSDDVYTPLTYENTLYNLFQTQWVRNYGSRRNPHYRPLFTMKKRFIRGRIYSNYDCHLLKDNFGEDASSSVGVYTTKYMTKTSKQVKSQYAEIFSKHSLDEASFIWDVVHCRVCKSLGFGWSDSADSRILSYLQSCVKRSLDNGSPYPLYFIPSTGKSCPLSPFYCKKGQVLPDSLHSVFYARSHDADDLPYTPASFVDAKVKNAISKLEMLDNYDNLADLFDLFD